MSRYYSKVAKSIPSTREVFLLNGGPRKTAAIDEKYRGLSVDELKSKLKKIGALEKADAFRLALFSFSKSLSDHGIAPQWQGLQEACATDEQSEALAEDAAIIDLYWLSITFPKHKATNQRWQSIFADGFDLELAVSISERQLHNAKKIKYELNLSRFQQLTCLHFITASKFKAQGERSALSLLEAAKKQAETAYKREMRRSASMPQITEQIAAQRAQIRLCWILAEQSPTDAAKLYRWMTGQKTDKATIRRTIERMKSRVSRRHIDVSVDR